ncbi:MAG: polyphosphate kinase 1 [Gemmatimonadaceae bacterium]
MRWRRGDGPATDDSRPRFDIPRPEQLQWLLDAPLPLGLRSLPALRAFHRDIFLDAVDGSLAARGITCRFRIGADDRRHLTLDVGMPAGSAMPATRMRCGARVPEADLWTALDADNEPARRLRGLIDPAQLEVVLQVETERNIRQTIDGWLRRPRFEFDYDQCVVRDAGLSRSFRQLSIRRIRTGGRSLEQIARGVQEMHALHPVVADTRERAQLLLKWMQHEAEALASSASRVVVLIGQDDDRIALHVEGATARLPMQDGSGESVCRELMRRTFGADVENVLLVGTAPPRDRRPMLEVWLAPHAEAQRPNDGTLPTPGAIEWMSVRRAASLADASGVGDEVTSAALRILARSVVRDARLAGGRTRQSGEMPAAASGGSAARVPDTVGDPPDRVRRPVSSQLIGAEESQLDFDGRVLALAEDPEIPLLERLRFLAITGSNLDELFMVRVGALKAAGVEPAGEVLDDGDGLAPAERLDAIARLVPGIVARQERYWEQCRADLAAHGIAVLAWADLDAPQRAELREYFREDILPLLTPLAITLSAGHPFPLLPHLSLSVAVTILDDAGEAAHLAQIEVPASLPRFVHMQAGHAVVPVEEVIRANLEQLYPNVRLEHAHLFRVTRRAEVRPLKRAGARLLETVEEAAGRRSGGGGGGSAVVRIEVERDMPQLLRDLLIRELQREQSATASPLGASDIHEVGSLLDLGALHELAGLDLPRLRFPPFRGRSPLDGERRIFDVLREGDVLVHHPYDDFGETVLRFFAEAADDPAVVSLKLTLYRAGKRSPVVDALIRAANAGKDVAVFVELKARFDEEHNVRWARQLQQAGIHVVYGLPGLKTHAKVALVIRREDDRLRQYVHIGTGNYNADTARQYTDLGLLSASELLGTDVADLFNEITGSSLGPRRTPRGCLVAPRHLLPGLLSRIAREVEHAKAGRGGRIRAKMNGLSDAEVVRALYDASGAGVEIDLIVRGICTLRPGVPGLSERIRVVSCLGRFLEHARIVHFGNGGDPEYFIGSADWRRRNLRRRVELLAPVTDAACRGRLDRLLDLEVHDPAAWELGPDCTWRRRVRAAGAVTAQELLLRGL